MLRIIVPPDIYMDEGQIVIEGGVFEGDFDLGTIVGDVLLAEVLNGE